MHTAARPRSNRALRSGCFGVLALFTLLVATSCPANTDLDGDGIVDSLDNCPTVANADQADADSNGIGDLCDTGTTRCAPPFEGGPVDDCDSDGVPNNVDNCPNATNPDQSDSDGDGIGDACRPPSPCAQGVQVVAPIDTPLTFDILDRTGRVVKSKATTNSCIALSPDTYSLRQVEPPQHTFADPVVIRENDATIVFATVLKLRLPTGLSNARFDLKRKTSSEPTLVGLPGNSDLLIGIGEYQVTRSGEPEIVFLDTEFVDSVNTIVPIGGLKLSAPQGANNSRYILWGGVEGGRVLANDQSPNVVLATPPGSYRLTEDGVRNPRLEFYQEFGKLVEVRDAEVTEVKLGAVRYSGPVLDFAIYARNRQDLLGQNRKPGDLIALPPARYRLVDRAANRDLSGCYDINGSLPITAGNIVECK